MGQEKIILGLLITTLLVACTSTPADVENGNGGIVDISETGVHRTIELDGDVMTVTLHVVLNSGARFYLFEEKLPAGAEFVEADVEKTGDSLKHVIFTDAESTSYTYKIKVQSGSTIFFDGVYAIDGMDKEAAIKGITEAHT